MDLADGTLQDKINELSTKKLHFSSEEIVKMIKNLVMALHNIMIDKNLQHRDIKPSNILHINDDWYLADFGVSCFKK